MQREEPYLGLTSPGEFRDGFVPSRGNRETGAAWLSSARVVRCWVKSRNERNPYLWLPARHGGDSKETASVINWRKVGTTSSHYGLYVQGYTRATMADTEGCNTVMWSKSQKVGLSSDWSLQLDSMKLESLVIACQHNAVNTFPGLVHTARQVSRVDCTRRR